MPRKPNTNFAETDTQSDDVVVFEPVTVSNVDSDHTKARVKGTWKMYWGRQVFNFEDGKSYKLPNDLFHYLRKSGNIYDTMG
jgi:hypothetical protein